MNQSIRSRAQGFALTAGAAAVLSASLLWTNTMDLHDGVIPMKVVYAAELDAQAKIQSERTDAIVDSAMFESSESITESSDAEALGEHVASVSTGFEQTLEDVEQRSDFTPATEITTESTPFVESPKSNPTQTYTPSGSTGVLNAYNGTVQGPSGKETYYNLPMGGVIKIMRNMGYSEEEYPYWIRDDGVKMFGPYVMVAASLDIRPKGTIIECSRGTAIVVDTGDFAKSNQTQLDVATNW